MAPSLFKTREKQILAGLFLSKFDQEGLQALGFNSFREAYNVIGYALGGRPSSIKNYRDELDPLFSHTRKGWRNRPMRDHCQTIAEQYGRLSLNDFALLLKPLIYAQGAADVFAERMQEEEEDQPHASLFARRLITGQAAERYFENEHPNLPDLRDYSLSNVTHTGCGFDYMLNKQNDSNFLAVEVKGLNERHGSVALTEKEYRIAGKLSNRYYLFIVRNFQETPFHDIHCNPLRGDLVFSRRESRTVQITWQLSV